MRALCIDLDNVVARTDEVMRAVIRDLSREGVDLSYEDIVCFEYWRCRDAAGRRIDKAEWPKIHQQFTMKHLHDVQPLERAIECIAQLSTAFEIHIATSRLEEGRAGTVEWLVRNRVPYTQLHFVNSCEKHLIERRFAAAVDDDREQAYLFHARGVRAFLIAHPWNHVSGLSPVARVGDWPELARQILRL